ncbi:MAG TPA: hypothetical protein VGA03_13780 [Anaerolineales bacterium]
MSCRTERAGTGTTLSWKGSKASRNRPRRFDESKIAADPASRRILVTRGQLLYEWALLQHKLQGRDSQKHRELLEVSEPEAHPLFVVVPGEIESWERRKDL